MLVAFGVVLEVQTETIERIYTLKTMATYPNLEGVDESTLESLRH